MIQQIKNSLRNWNWAFFSIFALTFVSCNKTIHLTKADRRWMPYLGNESLVFKANSSEMDTIYLIGKDTLWGHPDPLFSLRKYEILSVFSRFKDMYDDGVNFRYLQNTFISIKRTINSGSDLLINFNSKSAKFYRFNPIRIDSLNSVEPKTFRVGQSIYNDVYVFNSEDDNGLYKERNDYITKIYWSKSRGVVRFDKQRGEYWELISK